MKIKFMGAARTVTGSCFIIETGSRRFAVDCGMHQGNKEIEKRNGSTAGYDPAGLEFILVTHAHIDHAGLLPRIVKDGFRGPIYATPPTLDLLKILLLDSAHIQEMEAQWKTRKCLRHGDSKVEPLYTRRDAEETTRQFREVFYDRVVTLGDGLTVTFRDAGHILGAAILELAVTEDGRTSRLVFSGDVGRPAQLIVKDPTVVTAADYLFMESTYGNRDHKNENESVAELAEAIAFSYRQGEKVIIPSFAVERTQELLYCLHLLDRSGRLPKDMPVYVDSPLAVQATDIFHKYTEYYDDESKALLGKGEDPLSFPQLRFTRSTEESMQINNTSGAAVVISASGMAHAGRIRHHLRHNLWRPGASVVFVGFQAQGTTGRHIVDGAKRVRIFNDDVAVQARVFTINGFSAHAGQSQLLSWLAGFRNPDLRVFLVHGEYAAQETLAEMIAKRFGYQTAIPDYLEEVTLLPGREIARVAYPEQAAPAIDWDYLLEDMEKRLEQLRARRTRLEGKGWVEQTEVRERLLELNRRLTSLISEL
ncbi:MAG TPA: MBL fold metallo-hydrolase [Syntrophales bacterium]|nr:MBL fold metallo-hydrolase [Syntrophales bacterium]